MAKKLVELSIKRLQVKENGSITNPKGNNVLTLSLVYPGPKQPLPSTVKALKLSDQADEDFTKLGYDERIVFKEEIFDRALLVAQLTDVEERSKLDKFLTALFGAIFKAAWSLLTGGVSNVLFAAVTESAAALHLESFKEGKSRIYVIGRAERLLTTGTLPKAGASKTLRLELRVPQDIKRKKLVWTDKSSKPVHKGFLVLEKDDQNGFLELTARVL